MKKSPKEEFIELMVEIQREKGLDELSSKLIGIMFIEPHDVTLEELSKRTGYSLSAVCTSMKFLEKLGLIKRFKKPGSRKLYFFMGKDMPSMLTEMVKRFEKYTSTLKTRIPGIIEAYRKEKSKSSREELKIVEKYYEQLILFDNMMKKLIEMTETKNPNLRTKKQEIYK